MNLIHGLIFLIFINWFPQEGTSQEQNDWLEHFGSEVSLIPWKVLVDFCPLLGRFSMIKSGDWGLSFVKVNHDSVALAEFKMLTLGEERDFTKRVLFKEWFGLLLPTHQVDGDKFALDVANVN